MRPLCTAVLSLAILSSAAGCHKATPPAPTTTANLQSYPVKGVVVRPMPETGEVMLQHEAIPGFMDAMTMPYKLAEPNTLSELHTGDRMTARLQVERDADGTAHHARLDEIVITAQAKPDYKPTVQYHVPVAGDTVPDFKLTDQDARPVNLSDFRGRALLITFIYTRCPIDDFCPRMTRNFVAINSALSGSKQMHEGTALLSISFDPVFDTPSVLRAYADSYVGKDKEDFKHWSFASPSAESLPAMRQFFNVGATPGSGGGIDHSLSTILIDRAGKVAAFYPGNEWKPEEVIAQMRTLAGS